MSELDVLDLLDAKFRSGNTVPVERITITRAEFDTALAEQCTAAEEAVSKSLVGPIERDESYDRTYIPLPGGWEVQTKGKGSTFRLCNTKTNDRLAMGVGGGSFEHDMLEQMAREIHAACTKKETA